jgi:hypothetical protein
MAARSTQAYNIARVRLLLNDSDSVLFTDDEVIEDVLDDVSWRLPHRQKLSYNPSLKLYVSPDRDFEGEIDDDAGAWTGTANPEILAIYDGRTSSASEVTPDTWNLRRGSFGFTTAQTDRSYYIEGWINDPYLAASRLCERLVLKSSITPGTGETGGAIVGRYDYERMARTYRAQAKFRVIEIKRSRRNEFANY